MARSAPREPARASASRRTSLPTDTQTGALAQPRELRARGQQTMRRLLDAGVEVFARRGYHAARVDDVVKVARTSHGTFYLYFANKEDLFRALAEQVAQEMQQLAESLGPLGPDARGAAALHDWIGRFADLYDRSGPVIRAWTEAEIGSDDFGRLGTDVLTGFARVLTERIRAAGAPGLRPEIAALALVAMLERLHYYVLSEQVAIDRDDRVAMLTFVTQAALFGASVTR